MDAMPRVSIIILNWNGWEDTIECLESVYQITYPNYDVIVVDNGSENQSVENIKKYSSGRLPVESSFFKYSKENKPLHMTEYSQEDIEHGVNKEEYLLDVLPNKRLILICNRDNYGFAEGNNIAMRFALNTLKPEYILLLNNDTVVNGKFLYELIRESECRKNVGIAGPTILYYDYNNRTDVIWSAGGTINMWTGMRSAREVQEIDNPMEDKEPLDVDYVSGAALLIKCSIIQHVGFLDNDYFMYLEDIDWCYRAKKTGYSVLYVPSSTIWHKVSMSTGGEQSPKSLFFTVRNNILFMRKHSKSYHWPTYIFFATYHFVRRFLLVGGDKKRSLLHGIKWNIKDLFH
ncbi:MAG: glycosyltransferase family 2 protein [Clostridiaceae bacterium]|nr:glycosyltransferase family 2 protein [Clostridiaceae bacterium]